MINPFYAVMEATSNMQEAGMYTESTVAKSTQKLAQALAELYAYSNYCLRDLISGPNLPDNLWVAPIVPNHNTGDWCWCDKVMPPEYYNLDPGTSGLPDYGLDPSTDNNNTTITETSYNMTNQMFENLESTWNSMTQAKETLTNQVAENSQSSVQLANTVLQVVDYLGTLIQSTLG